MAKSKGKKKGKKKASRKAKGEEEEMEEKEEIEEKGEGQIAPMEGGKKGAGLLWVIPIVSIGLFLWVISMQLYIFEPYYFESGDQNPIALAAILQIVFIVVLALAYSSKTRSRVLKDEKIIQELCETYSEHEEEVGHSSSGGEVDGEELLEPEYVEAEIVEEEAPTAKPAMTIKGKDGKSWNVFEYPPQITGGVYSDTQPIPVAPDTLLKLRTIVARACILCDKKVECWPKVRRDISMDDFKFNAECKGGLRRLGAKDI